MSNQETRSEVPESVFTSKLPDRAVVFDNTLPVRKRKRVTAMEGLLRIVDAHLELEPDKPLDYARVRRMLGVSSVTMSKLKNRFRDAKYPLPLSTWEEARRKNPAKRAHRTNPNINRDALLAERERVEAVVIELRNKGKSLRSITEDLTQIPNIQPISASTVGRIVKAGVNTGEIIGSKGLSERDTAVRNLYYLRYTYPEIAKWVGLDESSVNHILERLEAKGEVTRRLKRARKK